MEKQSQSPVSSDTQEREQPPVIVPQNVQSGGKRADFRSTRDKKLDEVLDYFFLY
ncbi:MAG: hypothetical protein U0517_00870 [Candidatus Andersenbacteria bacterium]